MNTIDNVRQIKFLLLHKKHMQNLFNREITEKELMNNWLFFYALKYRMVYPFSN
jgi:hypothetical protein